MSIKVEIQAFDELATFDTEGLDIRLVVEPDFSWDDQHKAICETDNSKYYRVKTHSFRNREALQDLITLNASVGKTMVILLHNGSIYWPDGLGRSDVVTLRCVFPEEPELTE